VVVEPVNPRPHEAAVELDQPAFAVVRLVIIPPKNSVPDVNKWCIAVAIARFATGKMGIIMIVLGLSATEKAGAIGLLPNQSRRLKILYCKFFNIRIIYFT
jgi:hypothetical protein